MDVIEYQDPERRIATETIEHEIDGVNTVIAQDGQVVDLAFAHLVPKSKTRGVGDDDTTYVDTRSTSARRRAHAAKAEAGDEGEKPKRRAAKADDDSGE